MSFTTITQNLFRGNPTVITLVECNDDALEMYHVQPFLNAKDCVLGVAANYGPQRQLSSIAFSTLSRVLVVDIPARHIPQPKCITKQQQVAKSRRILQDHLLINPKFQKYAFKMDQFATALYLDLSIRIDDAVDMLSVSSGSGRESLHALMDAMGGETQLHRTNVVSLFFDTSRSSTAGVAANVALQAWAACRAATLPHMSSRFTSLARIDTFTLSSAHLSAVASIYRHADRLDALKPAFVKNDVENYTVKKGAVDVVCARFPTRIKTSKNQAIQIELQGTSKREVKGKGKGKEKGKGKGAGKEKGKGKGRGETTSQVVGRARDVSGRSAHISVKGAVQGDKILSVTTIGKDDPTSAEAIRQTIILKALQHESNIFSNPFFQALWLPAERSVWPKSKGQGRALPVHFTQDLNTSQRVAVQKMLSDDDENRIVMIQGPPGTGKTTVIAASVISHDRANSGQAIWVAAQSNVAVKNIAEKFIKVGFYKFKLLVSKDFHFDWYEHLYEELEPRLIRSDAFPKTVVEAGKLLLGCRVILCTLSMFSNPHIDVFLRITPVEMIVLDEASQIECGNYLPIFSHFRSTLSKLVFIGDDKQLPPYGQEDVPELRSIFEFPHLRRRALFLDTQYRMPLVIGSFISRHVYDGKLRSCHPSTTSKACRFIDVSNGRETNAGRSWTNKEEAHVVIKIARTYQSSGVSFRIITPYDAQRAYIENLLRGERLPWENKVFNVDSFQGNEDDHIIISVVRSQAPGFLKNQRRTNVMLTRCKKSMVICSSRNFLLGNASKTLVGKLAASVEAGCWMSEHEYLCGRVG